jgi:hypothetical protein
MTEPKRLSEAASNIVENLATRVAQRNGGRICPHHIVPYLPMSLGLIQTCLDDMVDGTSVHSDVRNELLEYEFAAYRDSPVERGILKLSAGSCVSCDRDLAEPSEEVLCPECSELLRKELNVLAERTAWPAQAVYEHEILYHAAEQTGPVHAATLAGSSRYTLQGIRQKLDRLTLDHYARQELDRKAGIMTYHFPDIEYPRHLYRKNMAVIRSYPASVMEEVQVKIMRILGALAVMLLLAIGAAICFQPLFPILVLVLLVAGPIVAWRIWHHKEKAGVE